MTNIMNQVYSTQAFPRRAVTAKAAGRAAGRAVVGALRMVLDRLADWRELSAQRHRLMQLDDRALDDIGLSRADVMAEVAKPLWRQRR